MSILLYSTKAIKCKGDGNTFTIPCHEVTTAPDWVEETDDYKLGLADGCLTVTDTQKKKIAAENGDLADGNDQEPPVDENGKGSNKGKVKNKETNDQEPPVDENQADK